MGALQDQDNACAARDAAHATDAEFLAHPEESASSRTARARRRRFALFIPVAIVWIVIDQVSKAYVDGTFQPGQVISDPIAGIFRFHYVCNTGGAWSIFSGATWALGAFSLVVCAALVVYLFVSAREASAGEALGLALVVAGGIGNAIDRFTLGFVVDFIEPTFIDFPIFNIADIGVTCGFVIFFVALLAREHANSKKGGATE